MILCRPVSLIKQSFKVKENVSSFISEVIALFCLFVFVFVLLYAPSQQLWSWPHFFLGKLEQAVNQFFVHILSLIITSLPLLVGTTVRTMTKCIGQYIYIYLFSMWDRSASPAYSEGSNEILRLIPQTQCLSGA